MLNYISLNYEPFCLLVGHLLRHPETYSNTFPQPFETYNRVRERETRERVASSRETLGELEVLKRGLNI